MIFNFNDLSISFDFPKGIIDSLKIRGIERLFADSPVFRARFRDKNGNPLIIASTEAKSCIEEQDGAIYSGFDALDASVRVTLADEGGEAAWRITVSPASELYFVEWVDFPALTLPKLTDSEGNKKNKILFPYNEGVIIDDTDVRDNMWLHHREPEYPSEGCYSIFPNMLCSQMIAYFWEDAGLYMGAHDPKRSVKEIEFLNENGGVSLRFRLFCGTDFGQSFTTEYPIILSVTDPKWESAAERYRRWFESELPKGIKKAVENDSLPEWYSDSPLVVTYPVRGVHDMDEMKPNKLFPYTNALPILEKIKKITDARLLVLLMHWEGTAPWAPPYTLPPFDEKKSFDAFLDSLHAQNDLLGVYCSGFGYTMQSNLIADYEKSDEYEQKQLYRAMCAGPDGKVAISKICTGQRSGYDICPASELGKAILNEAYAPLLESKLDYVQILDQNHGGSQYFCYSRDHGHAPSPGAWMTENMQNMLGEWNSIAQKTLLGCESAASEPFISNLQFSDNRFELNYWFGTPVPLYAYVYHEYVRNFMGNQVCCPFPSEINTLCRRIAYSFSIGDSMTLVLTQDGDIASYWGMRDFSLLPDKEKTLLMIANFTRFYKEQAKPYLYAGRMIPTPSVECESVSYPVCDKSYTVTLPAIFSSAWEAADKSRALILVNPEEKDTFCKVEGKEITVPALDAIIIPM